MILAPSHPQRLNGNNCIRSKNYPLKKSTILIFNRNGSGCRFLLNRKDEIFRINLVF